MSQTQPCRTKTRADAPSTTVTPWDSSLERVNVGPLHLKGSNRKGERYTHSGGRCGRNECVPERCAHLLAMLLLLLLELQGGQARLLRGLKLERRRRRRRSRRR